MPFHDKHLFLVAFSGLGYSGWQKCSELSAELATITHWEGGRLIAHKSPGRLTFPDLTLEQGSTQDQELYDWFEQTASAAAEAGAIDPLFRREGDLFVLGRDQIPVLRYPLVGCWPKKFVATDGFDNTVDEKVMRSVTVSIDYWDRPEVLR